MSSNALTRSRWVLLAKIAWPTTLLLVTAGLAVVCFGGTRTHYGGLYGTWEHGWPLVFLNRDGYHESTRYSFWEYPEDFRPWMLLLDVLVFSGLFGILILGPRLSCNRHTKQHRNLAFSLSSLLVAITLCCLLLGNIGYSLAESRRERAVMAKLKQQGHHISSKYIGPVWLARLLGECNTEEESALHGCKGIRVFNYTGASDDSLQDLAVAMQSLRYLEQLICGDGHFTDARLKSLAHPNREVHVEIIDCQLTWVTGSMFADPAEWPKLVTVNAGSTLLDDSGFANLSRIPSVVAINASRTKITKKSIAEAAKMPNLKQFIAYNMGFTAADCEALTARGVECHLESLEN